MKHPHEKYNHIQDPTGKIGANEPVFLLRAQDAFAPDVVTHWCELCEKEKLDPAMIAGVRQHVADMRAWQQKNVCKWPDQDALPGLTTRELDDVKDINKKIDEVVDPIIPGEINSENQEEVPEA